jgi:DNA invertase Pin-like site-specific DNA recombinase
MSTEHQQYSLDNQSLRIQTYADCHGFSVVKTYTDAARSGVVLKCRNGLRQLLHDVVSGNAGYKAILVYDISRWGRFQDADEAAHYEFLCKSAGVPVHYCAEVFLNDGSLANMLLKFLKRSMAGEYSRELGVKVLAGQKRLARLGFKQGGVPGYGFQRLLVSASHEPKQLLGRRERKSITQDRVVLLPGPDEEIEHVRQIFRSFIVERRSLRGIAKDLNSKGIPYLDGATWSRHVVRRMLGHPKYAGCNVFNRTSERLGSHRVHVKQEQWVLCPNAHPPIIDETTFAEAQKRFEAFSVPQSDRTVLNKLRCLLETNSRLSAQIIDDASEMVSVHTLRKRFGSLRAAYELIGYHKPGNWDANRIFLPLREQLLSRIQAMSPDEISIVKGRSRWRSLLQLREGITVSVLLAHLVSGWKGSKYWQIKPNLKERHLITLIARLDAENRTFLDFHVLAKIDAEKTFYLPARTKSLCGGVSLADLSSFCEVVRRCNSKAIEGL